MATFEIKDQALQDIIVLINNILNYSGLIIILSLLTAYAIVWQKERSEGYNPKNKLCVNCSESFARFDKDFLELQQRSPKFQFVVNDWRATNPSGNLDYSTKYNLWFAYNLESSGNLDMAAQVYDKYGLWKQSGRVRKEARTSVVKHVNVDANQLIEYVSLHGLAIPYKCQSCGAVLRIDKDVKGSNLASCLYCGSLFDINRMAELIIASLK